VYRNDYFDTIDDKIIVECSLEKILLEEDLNILIKIYNEEREVAKKKADQAHEENRLRLR
jgi:hypothetical protein